MKILCLITLSLYSIAHGGSLPLEDEILPPGISVSGHLERSQYTLNLVSQNYDAINALLPDDLSAKDRILSGVVEELLEDLRELIINGNDNVPPLDPLVFPVIGPYRFDAAPGVLAEGSINNLRMEGLKWFLADRININPIRLIVGLSLTLPWLSVTGNYDARARALLVTHRAGGNFRVFAHRIEVDVDMRMGTNIFGGGHLILRELDIKIDIHDTQISITGMTGSSLINNWISRTVQNVSQEFIQSQLEEFSRILSEELFDVINEVLRDFTVSDIFG